MRATELKKMVVLDNRDVEIGKVSDICIDLDKFKVENILVSTGGFVKILYFEYGRFS